MQNRVACTLGSTSTGESHHHHLLAAADTADMSHHATTAADPQKMYQTNVASQTEEEVS